MDDLLVARDAALNRLLSLVGNPSNGAVLLRGPRGVGRSSVAAAAAKRLEGAGVRVWHLMGTAALRNVPFAALAPVLPSHLRPDESTTITAMLRVLAAGPRSQALIVDDVDLLDPSSLAVVTGAVVQRSVGVVATCPADGVPDELNRFVVEDRLVVVDLPPLGPAGTEEVLHAHGLPVVDELVARSGGLPALAVAAARDLADGVPATEVGPQLAAVGRRWLDHLDETERDCVELLATTGAMPAAVLAREHGARVLEGLERRGWVQVRPGSGGPRVALADERQRRVLAAGVGELARVRLRARAGAALADEGTDGDAVRAATWLLDAGERVEVELLLRGAHGALERLDASAALRLSSAAMQVAEDSGAALVHGVALSRVGRPHEAERVLRRLAATGQQPVEVARARAHNFAMVLADVPRAMEVLREAHAAQPDGGDLLIADLGLYASLAGDLETVLRSTGEVLETAPAGPARLTALANRGLAEVLRGRLTDARQLREEATELAATLQAPLVTAELATQELLAALARDDVATATRLGEAAVAAAEARPGTDLLARLVLAHARQRAGDLDRALEVLEGWSLDGPTTSDPYGMADQLLPATLASVLGQRGALLPAERHLRAQDRRPLTPRSRPWFATGRAVLAFQRGQVADGVAVVREAAAAQRDDQHLVWAGELLQVAVRMGGAAGVVEDVATLAAEVPEARVVQLAARHGRAATDQDSVELLAVARTAADRGLWLLAAEAATQAGVAAPGDARHALRASLFAAACRRRTTSAATPALRLPVQHLTDRQTEVALRAPSLSSQEISHELHIATRTVENHLHAVYNRLGVSGRDELAKLLPT